MSNVWLDLTAIVAAVLLGLAGLTLAITGLRLVLRLVRHSWRQRRNRQLSAWQRMAYTVLFTLLVSGLLLVAGLWVRYRWHG